MGLRCDILVAFSYGCISVYDNSDLTSHESAPLYRYAYREECGVGVRGRYVIAYWLLPLP
jgi:hypothetical protein